MLGRRRKGPRYGTNLWNQCESVKNDLPRTNNSVEGWHRGYQFGRRNVTIWMVFEAFKKDQCLTKKTIIDLKSGRNLEPPRKKFASYNKRISRIVQNYGSDLYLNENLLYWTDIAVLLSN